MEGLTNREIGGKPQRSTGTIEVYPANLMRKLKLKSLSELVRYAVRNGIVKAWARRKVIARSSSRRGRLR